MKIGSVILGFAMICVGIVDLAGQAPVLGIHPAVWFILGILLICSDSVWEKLARKKNPHENEESAPESRESSTSENDNE